MSEEASLDANDGIVARYRIAPDHPQQASSKQRQPRSPWLAREEHLRLLRSPLQDALQGRF